MKFLYIFVFQLLISSLNTLNSFMDLNIEKENSNPFEMLSNPNTFLKFPKQNENFIKPDKNDNLSRPPNSVPNKLKCLICNDVYTNKFDFQIMIEQQKRCDFYENKYNINKDSCILISKNVAYKFFDNGGDSYFDRDLATKIKNCRSFETKKEKSGFNENNCDTIGNKVCEILLNLNEKECENDLLYKSEEENKGVALENFMQFKEEKEKPKSFLKEIEKTEEKKDWSPPVNIQFKNVYSSVDKELEEISELEKTVKDLEQRTKEAKQNLFNKIIEAQASSKLIQDHLNQIINRVKTEMK